MGAVYFLKAPQLAQEISQSLFGPCPCLDFTKLAKLTKTGSDICVHQLVHLL